MEQGRPQGGTAQRHTNNDFIHLVLLLCSTGLQPLIDLVCSQVKEIQVIFHRVAVPQTVSQAHDPCENQEARAAYCTGTRAPRAGLPRNNQGGGNGRPQGAGQRVKC